MSSDALNFTKLIASGIVGVGTTRIVARIVGANVNADTLVDKVTMTAGVWALGGVAAKATKKYTDEYIDNAAAAVKETRANLKELYALGRIDRGDSTFVDEGLDAKDYMIDPETKTWRSVKKYNAAILRKLNRGKATPAERGYLLEFVVLAEGSDDQYVFIEDLPDTITLRKNKEGVWEEVRGSN